MLTITYFQKYATSKELVLAILDSKIEKGI